MMRQLLFFLPFFFCACNAQEYQVTFKIDMSSEKLGPVGLRGNISPLSNDKDYPMSDVDGDGIYEAVIAFNTSKKNLKFRFSNDDSIELQGSDDRILWFNREAIEVSYRFNEFEYYSQEEIKKLTYSKEQVKEDIATLKEIVQYIHPNIYKYRDSVQLHQDFVILESAILEEPNIVNVYKQVSKFLVNIKCSHTFTNPWNQGPDIKRAIFYQPDKIPFTFNRIGTRLFVDKNASDSDLLKSGWEILKINGVPAREVITKLTKYITADGNNYQKRLERLLVTGEEKFALFDIFYPLEFGSTDDFRLQLQDPVKKDTIEVTVKAVSKTKRTKKLMERYGDLAVTFDEGWKFKMLNDETALLSIKSFAVQEKDFNWQGFLDDAFESLKQQKAKNLIIDIRDNEGGQGEVAEYLVRRILRKPFQVPAMETTVRYEKIPEHFREHISTWAKFPYSFKGKFTHQDEGRYYLKPKYGVEAQTLKPHKTAFKGKVYLMTNAQNSSATHQMASYFSLIEGITLVGEQTGGNVQGLNGGFMFFLRLPNSRVEIDIPVMGMKIPLPGVESRDGGIEPDIALSNEPTDFLNDEDGVLNRLLALIDK